MKLGTISGTALAIAGAAVSVMAVAQTSGSLNIPENLQVMGEQNPNIRKATAIVNGEVITGTDVDHRMALIVASNQVELPPEELARLRAQVLRNLIDENLQIQAAVQQEITVDQREVDEYFARVATGYNQTPEVFTSYLRSIGSSERSLKKQIHAEMAWQRLQRRQIEPFVDVGDEEVQEIIDNLNASRGTSEFRVAEIFISASPETATEARANAARIVEQIRGGASFAAYARQFSEASTAAVGGDLGWVRIEQLPQELASVVQEMTVGGITNPIPVPGGFSILALADSRKILTADPRDAVMSLMQMSLSFTPDTPQETMRSKANELASATQAMGGCGRAAETAQSIGAELISNDQVRVRDLPPALQNILLEMGIGQATQLLGSAERVSVFVLCGRDDPQEVTGPTYDQVYAQLSEQRVSRRAQRYLRDLRRDAVIDYR